MKPFVILRIKGHNRVRYKKMFNRAKFHKFRVNFVLHFLLRKKKFVSFVVESAKINSLSKFLK